MTDKEQIEEMVRIIDNGTNTTCFSRDKGYTKCGDCEECWTYSIAKILYNAGYRKVDDKFCLKHGEKDYYLTEEDAKNEKACEDCQRQARKETAREILQSLYDRCYERAKANGGKACDVIPIDILQFAAQYGVEIEE